MKYFIVVLDSSGNILDVSPFFQYFGLTDAGTALSSYLLDTPEAYMGFVWLLRDGFHVELLLDCFLSEVVGHEK